MEKPLVSVIIPSYNHQKYVQKTIESIVNQTYDNFELIVIDDGSKDNSREILTKLAKKYDFTLIFQENQGLSKTLNYAIKKLAKGQYITPVASDDYWDKQNLEKKILFMKANPQFDLCFSNIYIIEDESIYESGNGCYKSGWLFEDYLLGKCQILAGAAMAPRQVFLDAGLYTPGLIAEDLDLYLRIAEKHQIGYIDEPLVYYRYHANNTHKKTKEMTKSIMQSLDKWKHKSIYAEAKRNRYVSRFHVNSIYEKLEALKMIPRLLIQYKTLPLWGLCRLLIPRPCWMFIRKYHAYKNRLNSHNGYVIK
jgi:alpha-1,3-rhamnosyltransferase